MTVRGAIAHLRAEPQDAFYYWQGILRYWLFQRPALRWLIRWHVADQYRQRKNWASACYYAGECRCCGCRTPALFFAAKACSAGKPRYRHCAGQVSCYPKLTGQADWYWSQYNRIHARTSGASLLPRNLPAR